MMRLEEWPSSTEFGLQARLQNGALIFLTEGEGLQCLPHGHMRFSTPRHCWASVRGRSKWLWNAIPV
jgi:hypothetical protein